MKKLRLNAFWVLTALILTYCSPSGKQEKEAGPVTVMEEPFGEVEGKEVTLYTISNQQGLTVKITNYGGIITSLMVPDNTGKTGDVVLGYDNLQGYLTATPYFGSIIGRYGNRIAGGQFTLNDKVYNLAKNNGANHLHGGLKGFDKVVWDAKVVKGADAVSLVLSYLSPDGEEGYPGNLQVEVTYIIDEGNQVRIDYRATTDQPTIINLTNHSYFNLTGDPRQTILDHEIMIKSDNFLPVDSTLIPTGVFQKVEGTPFDFSGFRRIGDSINVENEQLLIGGGYDHCWVMAKSPDGPEKVASLFDPSSGRLLEVITTEPGMQFYSGNFLNGSITGKNGVVYGHRSALCLETQHYPDSPNQEGFPAVTLVPGQEYSSSTIYRFSLRDE